MRLELIALYALQGDRSSCGVQARRATPTNGVFPHGSRLQELIFKQAKWSEEVNDYEAAADMYLKAKHFDKAIRILGLDANAPKLLEVMQR